MKTPELGNVTQLLQNFKSGSNALPLIAVHNGYRLWLGLLTYEKHQPKLVGFAQSNAIDAAVAVEEAKQRLSQSIDAKLPRHVVLVSSNAMPALLDLPVEPDKPRKAEEMDSMISWELESQVADNNDLCNLGAILCGRGIITAEQRQAIATELEVRRSAGNSLARFGEVALNMGFVDQNQLQESLQLQEKLVVTDAQLACGWQVQTLQREDDEEHQWLVAGMDVRMRKQWFNAFSASGLKLRDILSLTGSAAPRAAMLADLGNAVVVEASQDSIACYRLERSRFAAFQSHPRQQGRPLSDQCFGIVSEQIRSDTDKIFIIDSARKIGLDGDQSEDENPASQAEQLGELLQREVNWLIDDDALHDTGLSDVVLSAFYGSVVALQKHTIFDDDAFVLLAHIPPKEPPPPIWKNKQLYRYGIPAVLVLGLLGHGVYSVWLESNLQDRLDTLDIEYKKKLKLNKQISSISGDYKRKEEELTKLQQEVAESEKEFSRLNKTIIYRTRLIPRLVKTVSLSVTNSVMLDSVIEPKRDSRNRFNVTAWAMDNPSASEFVDRLQQLVGRLNYRVADPDITTGIGRYGLNGYTINLWLIPLDIDKNKGKKS